MSLSGLSSLSGLTSLAGETGYVAKLLSLGPVRPIGFWPLADAALSATVRDCGANALTGAAARLVSMLGSGRQYYANLANYSYTDIYSAGLNAVYNPAECGAIIRVKVNDPATFWTDGLSHRFFIINADANNSLTIRKDQADPGNITYRRWGSASSSVVAASHAAEAGWMTLGVSVSESADQFRAFYNGAQDGATQTGLGAHVGALSATGCVIGATDTNGVNPMHGWLGDLILTLNGVVPTPAAMSAVHAALAAGTLTSFTLDQHFGSGNWAWFPLNDADIDDLSGSDYHARGYALTVQPATIPPSQLFDGATSWINLWSPALASAFNGVAGTIAFWGRVTNAGVWADGVARYPLVVYADANNYAAITKSSVANRLTAGYVAGGTAKAVNFTTSSTAFFHAAMTWDKQAGASGEMKFYVAGTQRGTTQTSLGTWVGLPVNLQTCIGAASLGPSGVWSGVLAHAAIWPVALNAAQIAALVIYP